MPTVSRRQRPASRASSAAYAEAWDETLPAQPEAARRQEGGRSSTARRHAHTWDTGIFCAVLLLQVIGMVALFSASYATAYYTFHGDSLHYVTRQGAVALVGIAAMILISKMPYAVYGRLHKLLIALSVVLLILVAIPGVGQVLNGARRWLFGFQPSELAKLTTIICFSYWIARDTQGIRRFTGLIRPYGLLLLLYIVLLALEPHTSAMMIICGIGVCILIAGGMRMWYFVPICIAGAGALAAFYFMFGHVQERFSVWLDPFSDMTHLGFQGSMSQIAIGSGGFFGLGLGQGRQKHLYLPESPNDFIFSSWCEEMGFIGAMLVILLFAYLIFRGFRVARAAPDKFGAMLATGITAKLAIQTLMNLFVVTGIAPVTGASLPFFSYGGTALLLQLGEMGILLNVSRYMRIDMRNQD